MRARCRKIERRWQWRTDRWRSRYWRATQNGGTFLLPGFAKFVVVETEMLWALEALLKP
jgi:hypothetical protein